MACFVFLGVSDFVQMLCCLARVCDGVIAIPELILYASLRLS